MSDDSREKNETDDIMGYHNKRISWNDANTTKQLINNS